MSGWGSTAEVRQAIPITPLSIARRRSSASWQPLLVSRARGTSAPPNWRGNCGTQSLTRPITRCRLALHHPSGARVKYLVNAMAIAKLDAALDEVIREPFLAQHFDHWGGMLEGL